MVIPYNNTSSPVSSDPSNLNSTPKIRFRYLYGTFNSDSQATRSTSTIIWYRFGLGQSVFKFKTSISGDTYDLKNTSIDRKSVV